MPPKELRARAKEAAESQEQNEQNQGENTVNETVGSGTPTESILYVDNALEYTTNNYLGIMLEMQQFESVGSILREETPPPGIKTEINHTITRQEAMDQVGEMIQKILTGSNSIQLNKELTAVINENIIAVLPQDEKMVLQIWSSMIKNTDINEWTKKAVGDKLEHSWTETVIQPGPAI
ncbi:hypothetical protein GGI43DRAFT_274017 [Trichoderma evansii]